MAVVTWAGWCGRPAGRPTKVAWGAAEALSATVVATGEQQPACPSGNSPALNLSADYFNPV